MSELIKTDQELEQEVTRLESLWKPFGIRGLLLQLFRWVIGSKLNKNDVTKFSPNHFRWVEDDKGNKFIEVIFPQTQDVSGLIEKINALEKEIEELKSVL
jgi:hypothetical protein